MLLTILIPSYNRKDDLIYNLSLLEEMIIANNLQTVVSIIVSNNFSTDSTAISLQEFKKQTEVHLTIFNQSENIGLEKNALFVLKQATSQYVMFLGDDDYIGKEYLLKVLSILREEQDISCIIPSFIGIDCEKNILKNVGRDFNDKTQKYNKGFKSCLNFSWRAHQMSGLVFRKNDLYDKYINNGVNNIYPFIYFASLSILDGNIYHVTEYPVKVTQVAQMKKDWTYGSDGLIPDIFDNYKRLNVNILKRYLLEVKLLWAHSIRFMSYRKISNKAFLIAIYNIMKSSKTSFLTRFTLPFIVLLVSCRDLLKKFYNLCK